MLTFLPALAASISLTAAAPAVGLPATNVSQPAPITARSPITAAAQPLVVADRDNDRDENRGRGKHKGEIVRSVIIHRENEEEVEEDNEAFDRDQFFARHCGPKQNVGRHLGHPGRHDMGRHLGCLDRGFFERTGFRGSFIRGCVVSLFSAGRVFSVQTARGVITVERPTLFGPNLGLGRIVTLTGFFAGNGVFVANNIDADGFAQGGACPFTTRAFPPVAPFNPAASGTLVVNGTITSVGGGSFRMLSTRGVITVDFTRATLIEFSNGEPVGSAALRDGENLTVVGSLAGGVLIARTIRINSGLTSQNTVLSGLVASTDLAADRFTVFSGLNATTVVVTPQTVIERGSATVDLFALRPFALVTVFGNMSDGVLMANVVRMNG